MRLPGRKKRVPAVPMVPHQSLPSQVVFTGNVARNVGGSGAYFNEYERHPQSVQCDQCGAEMPARPATLNVVSSGAMFSSQQPVAHQDVGTGYNITVSSGQVYLRKLFCRWECVEEWVKEKAPGELVGQRLARA